MASLKQASQPLDQWLVQRRVDAEALVANFEAARRAKTAPKSRTTRAA